MSIGSNTDLNNVHIAAHRAAKLPYEGCFGIGGQAARRSVMDNFLNSSNMLAHACISFTRSCQ